jgi:two-component system, OmpR family, alkaline phosphatase synthesis response regulator PhoP
MGNRPISQIRADLEGMSEMLDLTEAGLLALPGALKRFLGWIVVIRAATVEQAAGFLGETEDEAWSLLDKLVALGLIERLAVCGVPRYRVCLTPRSLRPPPELLKMLEEKEDGGMAKILIADDDAQVRDMLEETLEELADEGVELILAGNGMEALEAIRQHRPELAFLDVLMPKMNGLEVCNAAKNQYGLKDVHIVMLASEGQTYEKERLAEVGADRSLMKPLDPDEVYDTAVAVLRR